MNLIRKRALLFSLFSLLCVASFGHNTKKHEQKALKPDGPYIIYNSDSSMRFIKVNPDGSLLDTLYSSVPNDFTFKVFSHNKKHSFDVTLAKEHQRRPAFVKSKRKTLVMSDLHGDMKSFCSALLSNKVIDNSFNWIYGKNNLMIIGDIFDRGDDSTTLLWLIYKLENQAKEAGGSLFYLIGNHEDLVLKGDDRYLKKKYVAIADTLKMAHKDLYSKDSELGRWIRSKNIVQVINKDLFVHAGLSKEVLDYKLNLDEVNSSVSQYIGIPKKELQSIASKEIAFIYGTYGLIWYRGMSSDDPKYITLEKSDLDKILKQYGVKRVVVGHTVIDDITSRYNNKVITVNVDNDDNMEEGKGRGLLIDSGKYYIIYDIANKNHRLF